MGKRNKGRGSTKKKRGGKSKQQSIETKNNDVAPDTTPASVEASAEEQHDELRFNLGDIVYCNFGEDGWKSGTITKRYCSVDNGSGRIYPYGVQLDCNDTLAYVPHDTDGCIRRGPSAAIAASKERPDLRFSVGDRVDCYFEHDWASGTIIMRHCPRLGDTRPVNTRRIYPYGVRLDNGEIIYAPYDADGTIRINEPTNLGAFKTGSRVDCLQNGEWASGTVLKYRPDWIEADPIRGSPYTILFDSSMDRPSSFWGSGNCIRASSEVVTNQIKKLRFNVGDRVECKAAGRGKCSWRPGTVIKLWYKETSFDVNFSAPYQVRLDTGSLIYSNFDEDASIRKYDYPAPSCWICFEDEQTEENPIVRECACRGEENGYVHIGCLKKLAISRAEDNVSYQEGIDDENPFTKCITCKQEFKESSHSFSSIACGLFIAYGGDDKIGCIWNGVASSMVSHSLMTTNLAKAETFLVKRCNILTRILTDDIENPNRQLDLDLTRFYGDLALVYEEKGELDNMKRVLAESLPWIKALEKGTPSRRKINILSSLAKHAYLVGDTNDALKRYEECISLTRGRAAKNDMLLASLLVKIGNLELELGKIERGIEHISESVDIMTTVYGRDHGIVYQFVESLDNIRGGTKVTIPKTLMRLDFSGW